MNEITFPLTLDTLGDAVADLHAALLQLVERDVIDVPRRQRQALMRERAEQAFGEATALFVLAFQQVRELRADGMVDRTTADALNAQLDAWGLIERDEAERMEVAGRIAEADGRGVARLVVRAFDKLLAKEATLGETVTDADGRYAITYWPRALLNPERGQADLIVRVFDADQTQRAASPWIVNALAEETVNLLLGDQEYRGPSWIEQLADALAEYVDGVEPDTIEPRDVVSLAAATELPATAIHHYVRALAWRREWTVLPPEVFFAWFQTGLAPRWSALLEHDATTLRRLAEQAVEANLVPRSTLDALDDLDAELVAWRSRFVLDANDRPISRGSLGQLLRASALDRGQRRALVEQWQTFDGDASELWARQRSELGEATARDLEATLELGYLTRNNVALVEAMKQRRGVRSLDDVAGWQSDDWLELIEDGAVELPEDLRGADEPERRRHYADALTRATETLVPTRVLADALARDVEIDSRQLDRFFERHPRFDFREQTVQQLVGEQPDAFAGFDDPEAARREVEAVQRVFHLSPPENRAPVAKTLWRNQLHSAWSVMLRGEESLTRLLGPRDAGRVHRQALAAQQLSQSAWLQNLDQTNAYGHVLPRRTRSADSLPDIESLFGEQGYCECRHCDSFFSPSAYLVDLLLFLQRATLDPSQADRLHDTVLEQLLARRPDLANLDLGCANADTPLPTIDLINEVLEAAISQRAYDRRQVTFGGRTVTLPVATADDPVPQTETEADILEAMPQHLDAAAYDVLRGADAEPPPIFPWHLPFDLWAAEVRAFLDHVGAPRWQLMESALGDGPNAESAAEALGIDPAERRILLDADPAVERLARAWGLDRSLAPLDAVETVLARSGLDYDELRRLLTLRYIRGRRAEPALEVRFEPPSSCQLSDARLHIREPGALGRLHRFVRLQRRVGTASEDLDRTLVAFGAEIDAALLEDLAHLDRLEAALPRRIARADILTWFGPLDTHSYGRQPSPFAARFADRALDRRIVTELRLDPDGTELQQAAGGEPTRLDLELSDLPDLQAHLLAALRWNATELSAVVRDAWGGTQFDLTLASLSYLVRVASFCRALRLDVDDYLIAKALLGESPMPMPNGAPQVRPAACRRFIERLLSLRRVGLDPATLDALSRHRGAEPVPDALPLLVELRRELRHGVTPPDAATPPDDVLREQLGRFLDPATIEPALRVVRGDSSSDRDQQVELITTELRFFSDPAEAVARLVDSTASVAERVAYTLDALRSHLAEGMVIQRLAEAAVTSVDLAERLLRGLLRHPSDDALPAVRTFFEPAFLAETEGDEPFDAEAWPWQTEIVVRLSKIGRLAALLELDDIALGCLLEHGAAAGLPDIARLPVSETDAGLDPSVGEAWHRLAELVQLQRDGIAGSGSVFELLGLAFEPQVERAALLDAVAEATGWSLADLHHVTGTEGLGLVHPEGFRAADWLVRTARTLALVSRVGTSAQRVARWTESELGEAHARSVRHATRSKYGPQRWLEVSTTVRAELRERQRDALVAFVLHHRLQHDGRPFVDEDDLYGYFLIDPRTSACATTSRTLLATASVQLYVQRILLQLEPGSSLSQRLAEEWSWRKRYRVWEANRKVLMWPENWIEPELRDDKSPFFQELENELLQDELNEQTAERAFASYLRKLHEVARLEIAGVHFDGATLHVFARSFDVPHTTWYRRWEERRRWSAWERIELDITNSEGVEPPPSGVLLLPVVHHRRLFLFWPIFSPQRDEPDEDRQGAIRFAEFLLDLAEEEVRMLQDAADVATGTIAAAKQKARDLERQIAELEAGHPYYRIQLAYSEYRGGSWSAKHLAREAITTPYLEGKLAGGKALSRYFFQPEPSEHGRLAVRCHYSRGTGDYRLRSYFEYDSCKGEVVAVHEAGYDVLDEALPDPMRFMKARDDAGGARVPLRVQRSAGQVDQLLSEAPNGHLLSTSLDRGVHLYTAPFLYEDTRRTFLVETPRRRRIAMPRRSVASAVVVGKAASAPFEPAMKPVPRPKVVATQVDIAPSAVAVETYHAAAAAGGVLVRARRDGGTRTAAGRTVSPRAALDLDATADTPAFSAHALDARRVRIRPRGEYVFRTFYHPHACLFLEQLDEYGVDGLLDPDPETPEGAILARQATPNHLDELDFERDYAPNWDEVDRLAAPREIITFDHADPYASYNWELFFHIPLLIAGRLHQQQRFEAAQRWLHYIFDPTEPSGPAPARFWKIAPFHNYSPRAMERDLEKLLAGDLDDQIAAWQDDPFDPHLLARFRRLAYMKATVMKYLDNLIAWGDQLFRQDSRESIAEAAQLYVLAGQILGDRPVATEAKAKDTSTFADLANRIDGLGNAWVGIEAHHRHAAAPRAAARRRRRRPELPILVPQFCFPPNDKLLQYWDTVADRLFKIRHCMDIEGAVRRLPLFQPPIDPALLVRAAAAGIDLSSALSDLYAPLPKVRFATMIQHAKELCQDVKALGGALLEALEKRDDAALVRLRSAQENAVLEAQRDLRRQRIEELERTLDALVEQREVSRIRFEEYDERDFMNTAETLAFVLARAAGITHSVGVGVAAAGGAAYPVPDVFVGGLAGPMGGAISLNQVAGGEKTGKGITAASQWLEMAAAISRDLADMNATIGAFERRQDDWRLQRDVARQEMRQIDQTIAAAEIRIAIAEKDQENLERQIAHSEAIIEHHRSKFTDEQLYGWMVGQVSTVYFQTYQLAYDVAKQAERAMRFELGTDTRLIRFGYWDHLKKGLLAGEQLGLDVKRLEMAYLDAHRRHHELTAHVSLRQLAPVALLQLKHLGACEVQIPELFYDLAAPGHYDRRLHSVSLSIPAIAGPYTSVHCTLSLVASSVRRQSLLVEGQDEPYGRAPDRDDPRFTDFRGAVQSVVTSHGQDDNGLFTTQRPDDRYLPFEGYGAISSWRLELPAELRSFDYSTISDVVLHVRYTARQGGSALADAATRHVRTQIGEATADGLALMLDLRHDFSTEWHRFATGDADLELSIERSHFPFFVQSEPLELRQLRLYGFGDQDLVSEVIADAAALDDANDALATGGAFSVSLAESEVLERRHETRAFLVVLYGTA